MMARYDRIAALPIPDRDQAIPAWSVMRELAGRERESDAAGRARLYFIALRPVRRLTDRDFAVSDESHDRQLAQVRVEIDSMPASAPERGRLRVYLSAVGTRLPERVATATLDIAALAETRSLYEAAEEYALTALAAARHANPGVEARALTVLARLARETGRWETALAHGERAVELASAISFRSPWANAVTELATLHHARGEHAAGAGLLAAVRKRVAEWKDEPLLADAAEALAVTALAARLPEVAVHEGWFALHRIGDPDRRRRLLINIAEGLRGLHLHDGADACYAALAQAALGTGERASALVGRAAVAAEAGQTTAFRERHDTAMNEVVALVRTQQARLLVELGRACLLSGEAERALGHAAAACELASGPYRTMMVARAEE
ncbi:MAG: tetratricopeptide repeat protein, partial [Longimicrobiales bacterium]